MGLIHIKKGDKEYYIKVLHQSKYKLWHFPDTGLTCTHEGILVNTQQWMSKGLNWKNVYRAPRQVLKVLKAI